MKKILLVLLFFPTILFAQVTPGRYKLKLASDMLCMERNSSNWIRVAEDCRERSANCGLQVWQIVSSRVAPGVFQILLIGSGKQLTWNDGVAGAPTLPLTLETRYPNAKIKYQSFRIVANDKGSFQIQPAIEGTSKNDYYLSANVSAGAYFGVGIFNNTVSGNIKNAWVFAPPITPLPVQQSPSVIVTPPSDNKLDIDFKTGTDNLEMKPFQENVEIRIIVRNKADVILLNANKDQSWPNNAIKRVTVPLPAHITVDELREIHVYRNRKNGGTPTTTIFNVSEKDNWNLDKITATARIKENGVFKTYRFADLPSPVPGRPLFRFV